MNISQDNKKKKKKIELHTYNCLAGEYCHSTIDRYTKPSLPTNKPTNLSTGLDSSEYTHIYCHPGGKKCKKELPAKATQVINVRRGLESINIPEVPDNRVLYNIK